jgi:hypothetical protein
MMCPGGSCATSPGGPVSFATLRYAGEPLELGGMPVRPNE